MRPPKLTDLPQPPTNKKGWPWTEESQNIDWSKLNHNAPFLSIITPSFNQAQFLEETIRSVLLQNYPKIEYIIIDGGSTDGSLKIIKKYTKWISHWVSENDNGQSDALNKGFNLASGQLFGWLNSDDVLAADAINHLIYLRDKNPESVAWVGACRDIDINGAPIKFKMPRTGSIRQISNWGKDAWFAQPSCLFDANAFRQAGQIDSRLEYAMDVDLWMKLRYRGKFSTSNKVVSFPRQYPGIKTYRDIPMRRAEHIFLDIKHGLQDLARQKIIRLQKEALDKTQYKKLTRYFYYRTKLAFKIFLNRIIAGLRLKS